MHWFTNGKSILLHVLCKAWAHTYMAMVPARSSKTHFIQLSNSMHVSGWLTSGVRETQITSHLNGVSEDMKWNIAIAHQLKVSDKALTLCAFFLNWPPHSSSSLRCNAPSDTHMGRITNNCWCKFVGGVQMRGRMTYMEVLRSAGVTSL